MQRVLILSCSTGQGHNSCATAIKETFELQGVPCDIRDALGFISDKIATAVSKGHNFTYRYLPWAFKKGYHYSEIHPSVFDENSYSYRFLTIGTERLREFMVMGKYDTVICTHAFSAMMLTHILRQNPMPIQTAFVATDYTCSPSVEKSDLQRYFIPDVALTEEFAAAGIPRDRIIASGIPVRVDFYAKTEKREAKRLVGVQEDHLHLLVMCGSMGCGPMEKMVGDITTDLPDGTEITVVCGNNERLYEKMSHRYSQNLSIHVVGYSNQIPQYMDAADLYLTKPGGISVTEAAVKRLPMVFVNAVAGCETYNAEFFISRGCAVDIGNEASGCLRLLQNKLERERITEALNRCAPNNAAEIIYLELSGDSSYGNEIGCGLQEAAVP